MDNQILSTMPGVAPPYGQGGLEKKKKIIHNNLKFYIYLPLKKKNMGTP